MSEPYQKVKAARLTFKGGDLSTVKSIDKKKKKHKKKQKNLDAADVTNDFGEGVGEESSVLEEVEDGGENVYTIDAAKKMKYEELFPVESRKFGYDPKNKVTSSSGGKSVSVEQALDDRVKKKADRYCK